MSDLPEAKLNTEHRPFSIFRFLRMLCFGLLLQAIFTYSLGYCAGNTPLTLRHFSFHPLPDYVHMETVCFQFSQDSIPKIKSLEGKHPRLFFDLQPAVGSDLETEEIVSGKLVRSIRTFMHQVDKRLRVVIDLTKNFDYHVEQRYAQDKNTLCLIIQAEK